MKDLTSLKRINIVKTNDEYSGRDDYEEDDIMICYLEEG